MERSGPERGFGSGSSGQRRVWDRDDPSTSGRVGRAGGWTTRGHEGSLGSVEGSPSGCGGGVRGEGCEPVGDRGPVRWKSHRGRQGWGRVGWCVSRRVVAGVLVEGRPVEWGRGATRDGGKWERWEVVGLTWKGSKEGELELETETTNVEVAGVTLGFVG